MARHEDLDSTDVETDEAGEFAPARPRRRARKVALGLGVAAVVGLGAAWVGREEIADNLIASELDALGVRATYEVVQIGTDEQIIRNLVVGDPARPDLTVAEIRVKTRIGLGLPGLGRITLVRPRLFGSWHRGKLSFGALDPLVFTGSEEPAALPNLDVAIVDGRGLFETDAGRVGVSLEGAGGLRGGFKGELAATSRALSYAGCDTGPASIYGALRVSGGRPHLEGPVRMADLTCAKQGLSLTKAGLELDLTVDDTLDGGEARFGLDAGRLRTASAGMRAISGTGKVSYRSESLNARYELIASEPYSDAFRLAQATFTGWARSGQGLQTLEMEGDLSGESLRLGKDLSGSLARAGKSVQGTFAGPLLGKINAVFARELPRSTLTARVIARRNAKGEGSLVIPQARLSARSGDTLLALSRVQALLGEGVPRISGNFASSGGGLPRLEGRMESEGGGQTALHVRMADYAAGRDHLAIPEMVVRQDRGGNLSFFGKAVVGGQLPGGSVENLRLPVSGRWSTNGDLAMWPGCTPMTFDSLSLASFTLDANQLSVCPAPGGAILAAGAKGLRIAAGMPSLALSGHLGESPVRLETGPVGFAYPGTVVAEGVEVALGPDEAPSRFAISRIEASLEGDVAGTFDNADVSLAAVPLDLHQGAGTWRYTEGVLSLADSHFEVVDRTTPERFHPMVARGAGLKLADNVITGDALLREPTSDRAVVSAHIVHNLETAKGHADLGVDRLTFDKDLQPDQLSEMVKGLVSLVDGSVHGTGRIDWNTRGITSTGRFASEGIDFAAPFGPVEGVSGEVVFTDLLGLVTAPDQTLKIQSINPGIEVNDGTLSFELQPDYKLVVNGAQWPFMQGKLELEPATMTVGAVETRRYTLKVTGLDAASLVRHMELDNISATGVFDGQLPLVFDQAGGRIENGTLIARAPGGNVAYVGALTYEDLSTMGNFAFQTLKSVDYKTMQVTLDGSLSGEIITRIGFSGVSQGAGAKTNFLTKQIAKLPIRFIVNIKAPFFQLFGNMRSLYDSNYVTDPRALGLVDKDGKATTTSGSVAPFISIQPPVSEDTP